MGFVCTSRTHVGHKRKLNEDSVLFLPDRAMWVVADGMGGHDAGEVASAMVVEALAALPPASSFVNRIGKAVGAIESVNVQLIELAQAGGQGRTIGTTVVGLLAEANEFCCFWVGDSRAFRIANGSISQITRDHSLVQDLVDAGMLEAERAESHPNANVLTRAVGASHPLTVDTVTGTLEPGESFVLASDGLTRIVRDDEILAAVSRLGIEAAADKLLELTLSRGAPDNVSFVIVTVT
ncbi:MAG: serine/threonine-protein phosphatase [Novosphingobium sp.]|nr:serine/threonine-protein phosphatase [Novosphingobium sp.]